MSLCISIFPYTNKLCWFRLTLKRSNSGLLFSFVLGTNPSFVSCNGCSTPNFTYHGWSFEHFFTPLDTSLFLSFGQVVWDPTAWRLPYVQVTIQNRMYCFHVNVQGCINLTVCHMPNSLNYVTHNWTDCDWEMCDHVGMRKTNCRWFY